MKKKEKFDLSKFDNSIYPDDVLFDKEMDEKINKFFNNNNIEINEEESGSEIFINENLTFFENINKYFMKGPRKFDINKDDSVEIIKFMQDNLVKFKLMLSLLF